MPYPMNKHTLAEFEGWTVEDGVRCVVCPSCAFTFDAHHTDAATDRYSCPLCAEVRLLALRAAVQSMVEDGHPNAEDWFRIMQYHLAATAPAARQAPS